MSDQNLHGVILMALQKSFRLMFVMLCSLPCRDRTQSNFFRAMRDRLKQCNPVKYSNRPSLDNDLRVLAAACKHIPPADGTDLCALINDYKDTIRQKTGFCHLIYLIISLVSNKSNFWSFKSTIYYTL